MTAHFERDAQEVRNARRLVQTVVEDCGGMPRLREVREQFGPRVAKIVEGCTDSFGDPKPEWMERKKGYLAEVKHADVETRLVSAADKLHNVRTILADYRRDGESIWRRFSGKKEGTLWYYHALSDEYRRRNPNRITRELEIAVAELEQAVGGNYDPQKKKAAADAAGGGADEKDKAKEDKPKSGDKDKDKDK